MNNLSFDIGGTKVRVVEYTKTFIVVKEAVYQTKNFFQKNGISDLKRLLEKVKLDFGNKYYKLGVSFNCPIKNDKIFYSSLLGGKINVDLRSLFEAYFIFKEFSSDNDVFCMTKAEIEFGGAKKYMNILFVNLGTGIRVVATDYGSLIRGHNNLAGEISQDTNWVGEINKYVTTDFLPSGQGFETLSAEIYGEKISAQKAFEEKDKKLISLFVKYLSRIIARACYFYNPEAIFFAGSLILSRKHWLSQFKKEYSKVCHPLFKTDKIFFSKLKHPASLGALLD